MQSTGLQQPVSLLLPALQQWRISWPGESLLSALLYSQQPYVPVRQAGRDQPAQAQACNLTVQSVDGLQPVSLLPSVFLAVEDELAR